MRTHVLVVLLAAAGCSAPAPAGVEELSPEMLLDDPPESALILDVRSPDEFRSGHVPNAVNIPHDQLAERLDEVAGSKDTPVVVYCERGGRAGKAASVLLEAGHRDIRHLTGDMSEWRAAGRPTVTP